MLSLLWLIVVVALVLGAVNYFAPDPMKRWLLGAVLLVVLFALIGGANGWVEFPRGHGFRLCPTGVACLTR